MKEQTWCVDAGDQPAQGVNSHSFRFYSEHAHGRNFEHIKQVGGGAKQKDCVYRAVLLTARTISHLEQV